MGNKDKESVSGDLMFQRRVRGDRRNTRHPLTASDKGTGNNNEKPPSSGAAFTSGEFG